MIKLLTIIGARPQIIKASAISRAIRTQFADCVLEKILHTGQHYDQNMSQVFFEELSIPTPDYNLNVGSGNHGEQTAKMIEGIEKVLLAETFDGIIVYGDTNSTLAGAVAATKLHVPIFHIEAGLRSFNMAMPEEINRIVCDQLSSILFTPTQTAVDNLKNEGFETSPTKFINGKKRIIVNSGDIMYDNSLHFAKLASEKCDILSKLGVGANNYILATIHRDNNTDDLHRLAAIFTAMIEIATKNNIKIVLPLHPRTAKILKSEPKLSGKIEQSECFIVISPVSFLEMIVLEKNAKLIMTDSGGVQKEAYFFRKPCIILRPETEWVEITNEKVGIIADADSDVIVAAYKELNKRELAFPPLFGRGDAAQKIITEIIKYYV